MFQSYLAGRLCQSSSTLDVWYPALESGGRIAVEAAFFRLGLVVACEGIDPPTLLRCPLRASLKS